LLQFEDNAMTREMHFSEEKKAIVTDGFVVFLGSSKQGLNWYVKLGHRCFLPYPF